MQTLTPSNSSSMVGLPEKLESFQTAVTSHGKLGAVNLIKGVGILTGKIVQTLGNGLDPRKYEKNGRIQTIHLRFLNPEYLNTNEALKDLDYLIFHAYRKTIFGENISQTSLQESRKKVARLAIFLRRLSNNSGVIGKRSSGQTAFSHWLEAVYIYIQNDPQPNIDGIMRIGAHDSIEDPNFDSEGGTTWTEHFTLSRLEHLLGSSNLQKVRDYHTKPKHQNVQPNKNDVLVAAINESFPDRIPQLEKELAQRRKLERNRLHLEKIRYRLPDKYFLEKMADALSNMRNVDAFSIDGNTQDGIRKIERKCQEVLEYYLPRVIELHIGYFCQLYGEIRGLNEKYRLNLPIPAYYEKQYQQGIKQLKRQGNFIIELESRSINNTIGYETGRKSLSVLRKAK